MRGSFQMCWYYFYSRREYVYVYFHAHTSFIVIMREVTITQSPWKIITQRPSIHSITETPYKAHTRPSHYENRIMQVWDGMWRYVNFWATGIFMCDCLYGKLMNLFRNIFFQRNTNVHAHYMHNSDDLHVSYGKLNIQKNYINITEANLWNFTKFDKNILQTILFSRLIWRIIISKKMLPDYRMT